MGSNDLDDYGTGPSVRTVRLKHEHPPMLCSQIIDAAIRPGRLGYAPRTVRTMQPLSLGYAARILDLVATTGDGVVNWLDQVDATCPLRYCTDACGDSLSDRKAVARALDEIDGNATAGRDLLRRSTAREDEVA